jgi:hypothetical protein
MVEDSKSLTNQKRSETMNQREENRQAGETIGAKTRVTEEDAQKLEAEPDARLGEVTGGLIGLLRPA